MFAKYLKDLGLEVRMIGGIFLTNLDKTPRSVEATHAWVEVKINDKWVELDASGKPVSHLLRRSTELS
ncbi:transglutaminase domain-containing protein [Pyrococcus kukulkanii]